MRQKFHELGAKFLGDFLLVWRAIRAMDDTEQGSEEAQHLMRMIIPMAKWWSARQSVYSVRECMELMGGNGYIEDFVMPKLLRDVNVLPIWEGAGNIMVLDMLRASQKSNGLEIIIQQIRESASDSEQYGSLISENLDKLISTWKELEGMKDRDKIEATAKPLFEELILLYQMALMIEEKDDTSKAWINPALQFMASEFDGEIGIEEPISLQEVENLIAWDY
ncbi:MAG: acyl-CoA dehydrogenase family protein [Balneolaceae bacterium]|nr:acyl-CoA dehydrogenase family protein [Balneolaceae bacterium]